MLKSKRKMEKKKPTAPVVTPENEQVLEFFEIRIAIEKMERKLFLLKEKERTLLGQNPLLGNLVGTVDKAVRKREKKEELKKKKEEEEKK